MVLLTIFQDSVNNLPDMQPGSIVLFEDTVEEAVRIGQKTGKYYEIFDFATNRMIDWNEVNYREEDDWVYDQEEMIWKKNPETAELEAFNGLIHSMAKLVTHQLQPKSV